MKTAVFIFLSFIISLTSFGQISKEIPDSINYDLYFYIGCDNQAQKLKSYYLTTTINDSIYGFVSDSNGICRIPANDTLSVDIHSKFGVNREIINANWIDISDTVTIAPIYYAPTNTSFHIGPTYYAYFNCGQKCNGFHKSYRQDGKTWQKGRFKKGKLKKLKTYYSNGLLESKRKDRFLSSYFIQYDSSGKLISKYKRTLFFESYEYYDNKSEKYVKSN
ncbi:MAG: hypothetical protein GQ564_17845 [Bacteroidales bacterium]|nr:hypothetical protein [Bacteroidales bacterium]